MRQGQTSVAAARLPAWKLRRGDALRSRATRGDEAAFAELYRRHHRALYRYCRSILHHDEDARDALQSTMAKAFAALQTEERDFDLRPWLFRIAHNEAISLLRRRRDAVELDSAEVVGLDSLPAAVENRARLGDLVADLGDLPDRQRAALVLRELIGLDHDEIAAVIGGTPRAVRQTIFEARTALHECAQGREMACADVQRLLSDGDGRVVRRRTVRAHLRDCRSCREFKVALAQRPAELALLAPPLPAAAGAALLAEILAGANGTGALAGGAATAGSAGGAALGTKLAVIAATAATATGGVVATRLVAPDRAPAPTDRSSPAERSAPASVTAAPQTSYRVLRMARETAGSRGAGVGGDAPGRDRPRAAPPPHDTAEHAPPTRGDHETKPPYAPPGHARQPAKPPHEPSGHAGKPAKPPHTPPGHARKPAKPPHTPPGHARKPAKPPHTPPGHARKPAKPPHTPPGHARQPAKPPHTPSGHTRKPATPPQTPPPLKQGEAPEAPSAEAPAKSKPPTPAGAPPPAHQPADKAAKPAEEAGTQPLRADANPGKPSK